LLSSPPPLQNEIVNQRTGLATNVQGKGMAFISIAVLEAKELPLQPGRHGAVYMVVNVEGKNPEWTGADQTSSKRKERNPRWNGKDADFVFTDIGSKEGFVNMKIMEETAEGAKYLGRVYISLEDLYDQQLQDRSVLPSLPVFPISPDLPFSPFSHSLFLFLRPFFFPFFRFFRPPSSGLSFRTVFAGRSFPLHLPSLPSPPFVPSVPHQMAAH
jgi:hypothetical protein